MEKTVNYDSQMWRRLEGFPNINKQGAARRPIHMIELVLMRLERVNYIRGGGSNWAGIMTEKDKSGGLPFLFRLLSRRMC
jgi:hypothetical protein